MRWTTVDTIAYFLRKVMYTVYNVFYENILAYEVGTYLTFYNFSILLYVGWMTYRIYKVSVEERNSLLILYNEKIDSLRSSTEKEYVFLKELLYEIGNENMKLKEEVKLLKKKLSKIHIQTDRKEIGKRSQRLAKRKRVDYNTLNSGKSKL